jgi:predicted RNase H-like HicB family nuclease
MRRQFTASITREGDWYIAQCLEIDIVSQGESEDDALANLAEAIQLYFDPPVASHFPTIRAIEVEVGAA